MNWPLKDKTELYQALARAISDLIISKQIIYTGTLFSQNTSDVVTDNALIASNCLLAVICFSMLEVFLSLRQKTVKIVCSFKRRR